MAKEYAKQFYRSKEWQKTRASVMREKHYVCERCGGVGEIVHHKIRLTAKNIHDREIALDKKNLELVCWVCHNKIDHDNLLEDGVRLFDESGDYLPPFEN